MQSKTGLTKSNETEISKLRKVAESMLLLMVGQLGVSLVVLTLFAISFLASPLRPLVWAQLTAGAVLILGLLGLVSIVVFRYRKEIAGLLRKR